MAENITVFLRVKPEDDFNDASIEVDSDTTVILLPAPGKVSQATPHKRPDRTPSKTPFKTPSKTPYKTPRRGKGAPRTPRVPATPGARPKCFSYDHVFAPTSSQTDVWSKVEPRIKSVVEGFNATIMAYGQTGSGKTHTMMGVKGDKGVIPRAVAYLFNEIEARPSSQFLLNATYVELYNDAFRDLLAPQAKNEDDPKIRLRDRGGDMVLDGSPTLNVPVTSALDVLTLLDQGGLSRTVAATKMNAESSRSHAIFTIRMQCQTEEGKTLSSCLHLVDLAGSERAKKSGVEGIHMAEATAINSSLSALGDVLSALSSPAVGQKIVPYRNSKLTLLLRDSLGGNSNTIMIVTARSSMSNRQETHMSLQWASRAKLVCNKARANVNEKAGDITSLNKEVQELKRRLAEREQEFAALASQHVASDEDRRVLEEKLQTLSRLNTEEKGEFELRMSSLINQHEGTVAEQKYSYAALQASLDTHRCDMHKLRLELHFGEDQAARLQDEVEMLEEQNGALREARDGAVTQAMEMLKRMQSLGQKWDSENDAYEAKIAALENELAAERKRNDELEERLADENGQGEDVAELRKELAKAKAIARRAIEETKTFVAASSKTEKRNYAKIQKLNEEVTALKKQCKKMQNIPVMTSTPTRRDKAELAQGLPAITPIRPLSSATPHRLSNSAVLASPALGRSSSGLLLPSIEAMDSPYLPRTPTVKSQEQRDELEAAFPAMRGTISVNDAESTDTACNAESNDNVEREASEEDPAVILEEAEDPQHHGKRKRSTSHVSKRALKDKNQKEDTNAQDGDADLPPAKRKRKLFKLKKQPFTQTPKKLEKGDDVMDEIALGTYAVPKIKAGKSGPVRR